MGLLSALAGGMTMSPKPWALVPQRLARVGAVP